MAQRIVSQQFANAGRPGMARFADCAGEPHWIDYSGHAGRIVKQIMVLEKFGHRLTCYMPGLKGYIQ